MSLAILATQTLVREGAEKAMLLCYVIIILMAMLLIITKIGVAKL